MSTTYNLPYLNEVEYIRFAGNNWFDTGYTPTDPSAMLYLDATCRTAPDFETRIKQQNTGTSKTMIVVGTQTPNQSKGYGLGYRFLVNTSGGTRCVACHGASMTSIPLTSYVGQTNQKHTLFIRNNYRFGVDGVVKYESAASYVTPDSSFFIGSSRSRQTTYSVRDYSFIGDIFEVNIGTYISTTDVKTILRTYYPVIDKMGRIAFYEKYTKTFIYPATDKPLSVGPVVHTHDSDFEVDTESERLGSISGDTIVLTGDDVSYSYKVVDTLPSPTNSETRVVILSRAQAGYAEGQVLLATKTSAGWGWKAVATPTSGVGVPTAIKSHKIGNKVVVRWNDPDDVLDASGVTILRKWKKTRLVRKLGSYPTGPYDGSIRCESTTRNYYSERTFVDLLPANINQESPWFYKLFAYSEDGVVSTATTCQFSPPELLWSKMSTYIQGNRASSIFGIGDVIELPYSSFTGVNAIYNNMRLQVAGFDLVTPSAIKYRHSVTLIGYNVLTNLPLDEAWGDYRRVKDAIASADETYYEKNSTTGEYQVAVPQPTPGVRLTEISGYYTRVSDGRRTSGSNQWSETRLREWLNAVKTYLYVLTADTAPVAGKTYYVGSLDGSYSPAPTPYTGKNPRSMGWYEVKEPLTYLTNIMPPLMAFKKMSAEEEDLEGFYDCIISANIKTTLNKKIRSTSKFVETTTDRVYLPSITELTGSKNDGNSEGTHFPLFATNADRIRWKAGYTSVTPLAWWSRSPYIAPSGADMTSMNYVTQTGALSSTLSPLEARGVLFVITIG